MCVKLVVNISEQSDSNKYIFLLTHYIAGDVRTQGHSAGHIRDQRQGASVPLPPAAGPLRRWGGCGPADGA